MRLLAWSHWQPHAARSDKLQHDHHPAAQRDLSWHATSPNQWAQIFWELQEMLISNNWSVIHNAQHQRRSLTLCVAMLSKRVWQHAKQWQATWIWMQSCRCLRQNHSKRPKKESNCVGMMLCCCAEDWGYIEIFGSSVKSIDVQQSCLWRDCKDHKLVLCLPCECG